MMQAESHNRMPWIQDVLLLSLCRNLSFCPPAMIDRLVSPPIVLYAHLKVRVSELWAPTVLPVPNNTLVPSTLLAPVQPPMFCQLSNTLTTIHDTLRLSNPLDLLDTQSM
ncbi:hypothetical protein BDR04DRAFT_889601 [Suillus decipiens]|nr:hypothetical protein BDR04DRAFT_889601 [Suillus decipiens]